MVYQIQYYIGSNKFKLLVFNPELNKVLCRLALFRKMELSCFLELKPVMKKTPHGMYYYTTCTDGSFRKKLLYIRIWVNFFHCRLYVVTGEIPTIHQKYYDAASFLSYIYVNVKEGAITADVSKENFLYLLCKLYLIFMCEGHNIHITDLVLTQSVSMQYWYEKKYLAKPLVYVPLVALLYFRTSLEVKCDFWT